MSLLLFLQRVCKLGLRFRQAAIMVGPATAQAPRCSAETRKLTSDCPLAKGWAISENLVFGTQLVRTEAGLLLTYAKVTGGGLRFWW